MAESNHAMSWSYIAGFFDGEGHVGIGRQRKSGSESISTGYIRLTIVQSQERGRELFEQMARFLSERGVRSVIGVHHDGSVFKKAYKLRMSSRSAIAFLRGVLPYL